MNFAQLRHLLHIDTVFRISYDACMLLNHAVQLLKRNSGPKCLIQYILAAIIPSYSFFLMSRVLRISPLSLRFIKLYIYCCLVGCMTSVVLSSLFCCICCICGGIAHDEVYIDVCATLQKKRLLTINTLQEGIDRCRHGYQLCFYLPGSQEVPRLIQARFD